LGTTKGKQISGKEPRMTVKGREVERKHQKTNKKKAKRNKKRNEVASDKKWESAGEKETTEMHKRPQSFVGGLLPQSMGKAEAKEKTTKKGSRGEKAAKGWSQNLQKGGYKNRIEKQIK